MSIVTPKEVAKAIRVDNYGVLGTMLGWVLMKVLKISKINKIYDKHKNLKSLAFLNRMLKAFKIKVFLSLII